MSKRVDNSGGLRAFIDRRTCSTIIEAEQDVELAQQLTMPDYEAGIERLVILNVQACDWNCPQHITPRYTVDEIKALTSG